MSRLSSPAGLALDDATLSERVVAITGVDGGLTVNLTPEDHGNRLLVVDPSAGPVTLVLPFAYGTGDTYEVLLRAAVVSGSVIINATHHGTTSCKFVGTVFSHDSSNAVVNAYASTTNDIMTLTPANTGGAGGDYIKLQDIGGQVWAVVVGILHNDGDTPATPFSG